MIQLTLTVKMTTAQVVETSVTVNKHGPIQDYVHPDDQTQPTFEITPGFKPLTNLVKMNYKLASVFSYERFEYDLICIISIGPSTRLRPILNFPIFRKKAALLELLNIVFDLPKGFFWWKKKSNFLIWRRIRDITDNGS